MIFLVTDLDRTLLPNGPYADDKSIPELFKKLETVPHILCYATGRNLPMAQEAVRMWHIPLPDFLVAEVGTSLYRKSGNDLVTDTRWREYILSTQKNWSGEHIRSSLGTYDALTLQEEEKQNEFKISYYLSDHTKKDATLEIIHHTLAQESITAQVLWSIDPLADNVGLIDIIPATATKAGAVEFLRTKEGFEKEQTFYCGDSGNDILPLSRCYKSIVVKNAPEEVKEEVSKRVSDAKCTDNLYIATGTPTKNGNYASGIIEGLVHFGIITL
ncbi:MAG TPA: HAD-IIB family hydrolase [Candidatus Kaiserbacteria bacterium]|nr:HAD-IIB family hydrolase [Candidatus Kaiserbacteria bacterium]